MGSRSAVEVTTTYFARLRGTSNLLDWDSVFCNFKSGHSVGMRLTAALGHSVGIGISFAFGLGCDCIGELGNPFCASNKGCACTFKADARSIPFKSSCAVFENDISGGSLLKSAHGWPKVGFLPAASGFAEAGGGDWQNAMPPTHRNTAKNANRIRPPSVAGEHQRQNYSRVWPLAAYR